MQPSVVSKGCFLAGCWGITFQQRQNHKGGWGVWLGHRLNAVRCCRILSSGMMSRDFSSESSILGSYPGWYGEWAERVDSRTGPQNTPSVHICQCQSSSCLFLVCEEIRIGIESSDLQTCPSPQIIWEKAATDTQRWGKVCLGSGQFKKEKKWNLMKVWAVGLE